MELNWIESMKYPTRGLRGFVSIFADAIPLICPLKCNTSTSREALIFLMSSLSQCVVSCAIVRISSKPTSVFTCLGVATTHGLIN